MTRLCKHRWNAEE